MLKYRQFKQGRFYRQTRVKKHKSGKHWVRTIMSKVGTLRIGMGLIKFYKKSIKMIDPNNFRKSTISPETIVAEEVTTAATETAISEKPKSNIVDLIRASERSEAEALVSDSVSTSQSVEASIYNVISQSHSLPVSESVSASESLSNSVSESMGNTSTSLPNTGEEDSRIVSLVALGLLSTAFLAGRKRKDEELLD